MKGWDGTFANLVMCIGVGIKQDANNNCLLRPDRVFVWSKHTLAKLGSDAGEMQAKQLRFALQMMQLMYVLMMGHGAIVEGVPFRSTSDRCSSETVDNNSGNRNDNSRHKGGGTTAAAADGANS